MFVINLALTNEARIEESWLVINLGCNERACCCRDGRRAADGKNLPHRFPIQHCYWYGGLWDGFRQELSKLGWIEGKNLNIEYRFAEQKPERVPELAADLVRLKVDLIVVLGITAALAAKKATTTIPIVMTSVDDPVGEVWLPVWRGREATSLVSRLCHLN